MSGFQRADTAVLRTVRRNLIAGLDLVTDAINDGTFHRLGPKGEAPPSQSGQLTLMLLQAVTTELDRRSTLMQQAVIVDIDGTVALMGKGQPNRRNPFNWCRVGEDDPNQPVIDLVGILRSAGHRVLFVSGRSETCRLATQHWLVKYGAAVGFSADSDVLYMRPANDFRSDEVVKQEIYERYITNNYEIVYVIDDRDRVVRMWRSLGLTVLQCADGAF